MEARRRALMKFHKHFQAKARRTRDADERIAFDREARELASLILDYIELSMQCKSIIRRAERRAARRPS